VISEPSIHVQEEAEEEDLEGYDDEYDEYDEGDEEEEEVMITKLCEKKLLLSDWIPTITPDGKHYSQPQYR
jgi:hypothetical protein